MILRSGILEEPLMIDGILGKGKEIREVNEDVILEEDQNNSQLMDIIVQFASTDSRSPLRRKKAISRKSRAVSRLDKGGPSGEKGNENMSGVSRKNCAKRTLDEWCPDSQEKGGAVGNGLGRGEGRGTVEKVDIDVSCWVRNGRMGMGVWKTLEQVVTHHSRREGLWVRQIIPKVSFRPPKLTVSSITFPERLGELY
ncbi:multidrug resistance protein 1 [Striga asiatica]|uniref:Multidrug resistance protein 1 n=1 Tax=Striga asiatica TaxID=4170 RepID=A0A5A7QXU6_STRAF|nr:multidrug resistance protein 1 [Striga asiatica]